MNGSLLTKITKLPSSCGVKWAALLFWPGTVINVLIT